MTFEWPSTLVKLAHAALGVSQRDGDEYIGVEHVFEALVGMKDNGELARVLALVGASSDVVSMFRESRHSPDQRPAASSQCVGGPSPALRRRIEHAILIGKQNARDTDECVLLVAIIDWGLFESRLRDSSVKDSTIREIRKELFRAARLRWMAVWPDTGLNSFESTDKDS